MSPGHPMKAFPSAIPDVVSLEPTVYRDDRGFFLESFNERWFCDAVGRRVAFVQDNHSFSMRHVLRGLHYQIGEPQGKLVRVVSGEVFDVAVDIRRESPTFGRWVAFILSAQNKKQVWVPEGFAHGFLALSEQAEVLYKTTNYWSPQQERCIIWNDATLDIKWPISVPPILSAKDARGVPLVDAEVFSSNRPS